jgi:hypothetical protein
MVGFHVRDARHRSTVRARKSMALRLATGMRLARP